MDAVWLLSILYVTAGSAGVVCTLYATQGNFRPGTGKLMLAMSLAVLLWSFGLAVQTFGASPGLRFAGSRTAAVGYGLIFCLLLHYVLLLARPELPGRRPWLLPLLYLPGAVAVYGLALRPVLLRLPDDMLETSLGWVNVTAGGWVNFFYGYYLAYAALILLVLLLWRGRAPKAGQRAQASLLLGSLLLSILLGSVTDMVLVLRGVRFPSMASVFSLPPLAAISYCACRYGFMRPGRPDELEAILDKASRGRIHRASIYALVAGSLLNLLTGSSLARAAGFLSVPLFSALLLGVAGGIILLYRLRMDDGLRELWLAVLLSFSTVAVIMRFASYAGVTIWTMCFPVIILTLLFNRRLMLISALLSSGQTLLLLQCIAPGGRIVLDRDGHIARVGLILLTGMLAFYVNDIYRGRLAENARLARWQRTISEVSRSLVSADEGNLPERMAFVLRRCGAALSASGGTLALHNAAAGGGELSLDWSPDGSPDAVADCLRACARALPEPEPGVFLTPLNALPPAATQPARRLREAGATGLLLLPVHKAGERLGFLCYAVPEAEPGAPEALPPFLAIAANTLADTLARLRDLRAIEWTAYHDALTGLPNRLLFHDRLTQAIRLAGQEGAVLGVAFVDLDSFKSINDTLGHQGGNRLIAAAAAAISSCARPEDCVARFGGDEFVLLLRLSGPEELADRMRPVLKAIQTPFDVDGREYCVTGSVGVALFPRDGTDAETLLKHADLAMYQAKSMGKNQFALCSQPLKDRVRHSTRLTNLLFRAMEREQLQVHYQPQVSLETGQIVGLEALLRWRLPDEGFVSPQTFIPLAEQTGLIEPIGAWVLETACRRCRRWQELGFPELRMAVNLSVRQLENEGFPAMVAGILKQTGLAPQCLELEVTESAANSQAAGMAERLLRLKELGVKLSIDDFGTEYSSLERLKLTPADRIKLDIRFVRGIAQSDQDRAIAQVIINLAKSLELRVTAEGVETREQLDFLSCRMCDEVQGYYYYKPLPPEELEEVLRTQPHLSLPPPETCGC